MKNIQDSRMTKFLEKKYLTQIIEKHPILLGKMLLNVNINDIDKERISGLYTRIEFKTLIRKLLWTIINKFNTIEYNKIIEILSEFKLGFLDENYIFKRNKILLQDFHSNILCFDMLTEELISVKTSLIVKARFLKPIIIKNKISALQIKLNKIKYILAFDGENYSLSKEEPLKSENLIIYLQNENFVSLKFNQYYLTSKPNGEVKFKTTIMREWETFKKVNSCILNQKLGYDLFFSDIINIKNYSVNHNNQIPKIIWMFWDALPLPKLIESFVNKIKLQNASYQVNILGFHNLHEYIEIPIFEVDDVGMANKSDIIRLELLYKYGGVWLDASIILYQNMDWFLNIDKIYCYDLIGFYRDFSTVDRNFPIIENWFLACAPNNEFIQKWLIMLNPIKKLGAKAYFNMIKARPDYSTIVQKITRPSYLLAYLAQQIVLRENQNIYNFFLWRCENSAFVYQHMTGWKHIETQAYLSLLNKSSPFLKSTPIIKLINSDRVMFEALHNNKLTNPNSILGEIMR